MQVNSVNNQNSFGLKFGPKLKNDIRQIAIGVFKGEECGDKITKRTQDIFENRVRKICAMFPDGILEKENNIKYADISIYKPALLKKHSHTYFNVPYTNIVLTRGDKKDVIIPELFGGDTIMRFEILDILQALTRLKKEEKAAMKNPIVQQAIERAEKLFE